MDESRWAMQARLPSVNRLLKVAVSLLIIKVLASVVLKYVEYFPPDFGSDFLFGRQHYFWGAYVWAFYVHLVAGPLTLLLGLFLVSESMRVRFRAGHRILGRIQVVCVLVFLVPSGLWMARYPVGGWVAGLGLSCLAMATGACPVLGWNAARERRFGDHRRWMSRVFVLLTSAVWLRLIGGLATLAQFSEPWLDPLANWVSWLVPLFTWEWFQGVGDADPHPDQSLNTDPSFPVIEIKARR